MKKRILTIGATGMLGEPIARRLRKDGFSVRILARDQLKARTRFDENYDVVSGDVMDARSIENALRGCFGVHINLSGEIEQVGVENVVSVAAKSGIERISYISGTSVAEDTAWFPQTKRKLMAEKAIQECGVPYCIFRPTWFMESLPKFIKNSKAFIFGKQPNLYHFISADDFSRMVSKSYMLEDVKDKIFFIHGPEGFIFKDALKVYCSAFHPEITKISTIPYWMSKIIATIGRNGKMKFISDFMAFFEKVGERGTPVESNFILGQPRISLLEWIEHRKAGSGMAPAH